MDPRNTVGRTSAPSTGNRTPRPSPAHAAHVQLPDFQEVDADGLLHVLATHGIAEERVSRFQAPLEATKPIAAAESTYRRYRSHCMSAENALSKLSAIFVFQRNRTCYNSLSAREPECPRHNHPSWWPAP